MITIKPTEHLVGINVQGDYYDFEGFVDAVHRLTGIWPEEDYSDPYYASCNRLLGICYDIRHAYQGNRDILVRDNGLNREVMKWHKLIMSEQTVYYSVNILFPEALFVASTSEKLLAYAKRYYGKTGKKLKEKENWPIYHEYNQYVRDCATIRNFVGQVWGALGDVIGEVGLENILNAQCSYESYTHYAAQYIDEMDIALIKTKPEKRAGKLKTMAKRIINPDYTYYQVHREVAACAAEYGCSIHEVHDPKLEFPDEIEW